MSTYTILTDGDVFVTQRLQKQIQNTKIIAADGGMRHAKALNIQPNLWLGDFDSSKQSLQKKYAAITRMNFPTDKDKTDGQLAVEEAIKQGAKNIIICGALGGERTDHSVFHMAYALALKKAGHNIMLTSGNEEAYPIIAGHYKFDFPLNATASLVAMRDLQGLTLKGVKWPLDKANVPFGSSWTLSNQINNHFSLELMAGEALLFLSLPK